MFGTPKPTASLSSSLLARKGQARPAMRPQGFVGMSPATTQDDLGWNDMGEDHGHAPEPQPAAKPPVLRQIEALDERLNQPEPPQQPVAVPEPQPQAQTPLQAETAPQPAPRAPLAPAVAERLAREVAKKSKAAFTLRLDNDRHLRLRLASAVTNRSAQQLVTEALDAFLESLTEVEALARQVPAGNR
jgi:outer membrane biosynthesis protein TonB